jgi:hypothetical protein
LDDLTSAADELTNEMKKTSARKIQQQGCLAAAGREIILITEDG